METMMGLCTGPKLMAEGTAAGWPASLRRGRKLQGAPRGPDALSSEKPSFSSTPVSSPVDRQREGNHAQGAGNDAEFRGKKAIQHRFPLLGGVLFILIRGPSMELWNTSWEIASGTETRDQNLARQFQDVF